MLPAHLVRKSHRKGWRRRLAELLSVDIDRDPWAGIEAAHRRLQVSPTARALLGWARDRGISVHHDSALKGGHYAPEARRILLNGRMGADDLALALATGLRAAWAGEQGLLPFDHIHPVDQLPLARLLAADAAAIRAQVAHELARAGDGALEARLAGEGMEDLLEAGGHGLDPVDALRRRFCAWFDSKARLAGFDAAWTAHVNATLQACDIDFCPPRVKDLNSLKGRLTGLPGGKDYAADGLSLDLNAPL